MSFNSSTGILLNTFLFLSNHTPQNNIFADLNKAAAANNPAITDAICYGVYGCFSLAPPWSGDTERPLTYFPESPSEMNVKFRLYNRRNKNGEFFVDLNDPDKVKTFKINKNAKLFFITHGYLEGGEQPWLLDMAHALLDRERDSSVVIIDWRGGSSPPYARAATNIRLVGAMAAHVAHLIYEECHFQNLKNVHFIGHSLGAHLSGYAGYHLKHDFGLSLGRITGMDPAEPYFSKTDPLVRLDRTDADYVDVIHTDAKPFVSSGGLGLAEPIGHVDFYPNGGHTQPGCNQGVGQFIEERESFFWGVQKYLGCDHVRSYELFIESIKNPSTPYAITCESHTEYLLGNCFTCGVDDHYCIKFGYGSRESYQSLYATRDLVSSEALVAYMLTVGKKPYIRNQYKITVNVSNSMESKIHGGEVGKLKIVLYGKDRRNHTLKTEEMFFSEDPKLFEPGHKNTSVVAGSDVQAPIHAILEWKYSTNPLNPLTWRLLKSPRIYLADITIESLEHRSKIRMCPVLNEPVVEGSQSHFTPENCEVEDWNNVDPIAVPYMQ
ncbi:pancreatic lipase-related protein 2 [Culicoides brevitarsis]|uniref:pancreatic lipase-related protein 2 n=1 Tax=Culicoides brevitarsis TaxID=469753 RepID=UPI00307B7B1A